MEVILPFLDEDRSREFARMIYEVRLPFLQQMFDLYSASLPQITLRSGQIAEVSYAPEFRKAIESITSLMDEAVRIAVDSYVRKRGGYGSH